MKGDTNVIIVTDNKKVAEVGAPSQAHTIWEAQRGSSGRCVSWRPCQSGWAAATDWWPAGLVHCTHGCGTCHWLSGTSGGPVRDIKRFVLTKDPPAATSEQTQDYETAALSPYVCLPPGPSCIGLSSASYTSPTLPAAFAWPMRIHNFVKQWNRKVFLQSVDSNKCKTNICAYWHTAYL